MLKSNLLHSQKNKFFYFAIGLSILGLALFLWSTRTTAHEDVISAGAHSFDKWMKANDDERVKIYKEESKREFTSLEEVNKAVSFTIKYPENLKTNDLLGVFIGMGIEPGTNNFGTYAQPRPGFAEWYENGVVYSVFGDKTPLVKLINIANSMQNLEEKTTNNSQIENLPLEGGLSDEEIEKVQIEPSKPEIDE